MFWCELGGTKTFCCNGNWLFLVLGNGKILKVFPFEHSNGSSFCCHLWKSYSQAVLYCRVVVSARLQCWNFKQLILYVHQFPRQWMRLVTTAVI